MQTFKLTDFVSFQRPGNWFLFLELVRQQCVYMLNIFIGTFLGVSCWVRVVLVATCRVIIFHVKANFSPREAFL